MERSKRLAARRHKERKKESREEWLRFLSRMGLIILLTFTGCIWMQINCLLDSQTDLLDQVMQQRQEITQLHNQITDNEKAASEYQSVAAIGTNS